ncbi:MAG: hypothetical protein FJ303_17395 [Planctomycetes bacterium]|nr:hypothetical protein [Planctomycetota bacterium]
MWVCSKCGEAHQDQFKECWKCVGAEIEEPAPPPEPAPAEAEPERPLRSNGSVVLRTVIAAVVGWCLGFAVLQRYGMSASDAATNALGVGLFFAGVVGFFAWVVFPFEPAPSAADDKQADAGKPESSV